MLWLPSSGCLSVVTNGGIVGSATPWTAVASNATTLLDGAVTELIASGSNTRDSWGIEILITATGAATTASESALDILIGGATDDILIPALLCGYSTAASSGAVRYFFPLHIPAGLRIAAVLASVRTSITARVGCWLYGGGNPPFRVGRKVTAYGTQINNARGQAVSPAASGGAASVTEMTASSTDDHFYFLPGFQPATDTSITPAGWVNLGIGIGASTEQRIGTWWYGKDTSENSHNMIPMLGAFCHVPAATRLTMLASNSGANDAAYDGLIYAVS
jgi:hypothetical protein